MLCCAKYLYFESKRLTMSLLCAISGVTKFQHFCLCVTYFCFQSLTNARAKSLVLLSEPEVKTFKDITDSTLFSVNQKFAVYG